MRYTKRISATLTFLTALPALLAQSTGGGTPALTYLSNSSVKVQQVNGDCDWVTWDATITNKPPTCKPTVSQTATKADVLGSDVAASFEHNGELIMTFGDTIGPDSTYYPTWIGFQNTFKWLAHDPIARSTTQHAQDGLLLNFFMNGTHALAVAPVQPNGTAVDMGIDNVPEGGISLDGQIYLVIKTGSVTTSGNTDNSHAYTILSGFDETSQAFTAGRTISALPGGHFVTPLLYEAAAGQLGSPAPVQPEPDIVMFGLGDYRASNVYLAVTPKSQFVSGVDSSGKSATRYFSGLKQGQPAWSQNESDSVPVVTDLDPANPTIGNISAFYSTQLGLWLMTYDGGRESSSTSGVYFTYAPQPWGPWATPQLIFNDCRDKGLGNYVFYYYKTPAGNNCPSAMPAGVTSAPNSAGPSGPTIGDQTSNDPATTRGGTYAPYMIQRFTTISGSTLKIYYTLSTWNPYTVVLMESDLAITNPPAITYVGNAEGGNPIIAPNTWVEIFGSNLVPPGHSRAWQTADFVNNKMPTQLDGISVTVNGKAAFLAYISPGQINILTPPDAMNGPVQVVVNNNGSLSAGYTAQAQPTSPSFFLPTAGPYVLGQHPADNFSLLGPVSLYPGFTTPAKPGETVVLYANGFGAISPPVVSGLIAQVGTLSPLPTVTIGGIPANVTYAGINGLPGAFQLNVTVPLNAPSGDDQIIAIVNGVSTSPIAIITVQGSTPATTANFYVATYGSDSWSGALAGPNPGGTDGPFATFEHARAAVQALKKNGLTQVTVQFRGGTYYLPATEQLTAADSGTPATPIAYTNFPGETPVISGGMRVQNWTNVSGNKWTAPLPASTVYFENLFYNGARRLRPRLGGYVGTFYRVAATIYLDPLSKTKPNDNCSIFITGSGWECFDRFQYDPADPIAANWKNLVPAPGNTCGQTGGNQASIGDIELLDFEKFTTSKMRVSCVDTVNHIVYLTGPTTMPQANPGQVGYIAGHRYLVENVLDQLTLPGQWFLDRSVTPWVLTYLANSGENPNNDVVEAPQLPQVLAASNLQYVTFRGLTFAHDNFTVPAIGYPSGELDSGISAAVSFQNSQQITFDSSTVTQTSGAGLEIISCINGQSPSWCISPSTSAITTQNVVQNSAFYDLGASGIRIGEPGLTADSDGSVPQFITVQNNVVEGYGRTFPSVFGIGQGVGHDILYTHNDVYDGFHVAISICHCVGDTAKPSGNGAFNNTISFNHVYNLEQGIMNDGGAIRIGTGNQAFTATGNKILNNKVHDVTDASIQDSDGYGGNGIYLDNNTGLVDVENNLVYRVSDNAVNLPQGPPVPNEANTIKNNILAFARGSLINDSQPYPSGTLPPSPALAFVATNNLFYFDRSSASSPAFYGQGGCTYTGGVPYTSFQQWNSNLYWRVDGAFASDPQAFHVQPNAGAVTLCTDNTNKWTFYTFSGWQQTVGEDKQSVVQNPGFNNPAYPADDYSLPKGSPGAGFVVFDVTQAGRSNPVLKPPAIAATFPTKSFNPATDY